MRLQERRLRQSCLSWFHPLRCWSFRAETTKWYNQHGRHALTSISSVERHNNERVLLATAVGTPYLTPPRRIIALGQSRYQCLPMLNLGREKILPQPHAVPNGRNRKR